MLLALSVLAVPLAREQRHPAAGPPPPAGRIVRLDPALDALVPRDAVIERFDFGFVYAEGPVWTADGALVFSDLPANTIFKITATGQTSIVRKPSGYDRKDSPLGRFIGSNGLTLDRQGRLIICEHGNRRVSRLETDGRLTVLADAYDGKRLNSPNDVVVKSDGSIYFTDPPYGLFEIEDDPNKALPYAGIFRIRGGRVELLSSEWRRPNGLAFSPDERYLYVAHSDEARRAWMRFEVKADGTLGPATVFFDVTAEPLTGVPDGMKVDSQGHVYGTGPGGVWIISPDGRPLGRLEVPEQPANLAWGDDGRTLYITARSSIYRIRLNVGGPRPCC